MTNSSLCQTKILVSSSNFILDLANSIIFSSLKFICNFWITEICWIPDANYFIFIFNNMLCHFKLHCSYIYIVVILQLYIVKIGESSLSEKYKAISEVETGTKSSKVAEVLTTSLITITKREVKNVDLLKYLHDLIWYIWSSWIAWIVLSFRKRDGIISLAKSSRQV